ncbi:5-carboxymethyl-2-hydroxymuconate Delta-isomerase [Mangrovimonas aestuarii]|uniref:5-carboxymethyl-2-hydroxymuconate Delta-isomerase n=1 Tax=Mangrovimonas aestuarii TaxID=3018443 RepID=UPI002379651E|nr:5-carboxymethyl-2-hydroxymuconate Delta-isomerase [Mangrovimonas aestuarii]
MPHIVIECSENVISDVAPQTIIQKVFETTESTGLFGKGAVKVRLNPYKHYHSESEGEDFIHVFANIMEGRTVDQKKGLSKKIATELISMLPDVSCISVNIIDMEKACYSNRVML